MEWIFRWDRRNSPRPTTNKRTERRYPQFPTSPADFAHPISNGPTPTQTPARPASRHRIRRPQTHSRNPHKPRPNSDTTNPSTEIANFHSSNNRKTPHTLPKRRHGERRDRNSPFHVQPRQFGIPPICLRGRRPPLIATQKSIFGCVIRARWRKKSRVCRRREQ